MEKELLINSNTKENYLVYWLKKLLPIFSLIILLFYFILAHLKMNIEFGDFAYFYEQAKIQNIFQFLLKRYNEWSSRVFIELVMICVLRCPLIIFHILDIIVWISLFICLVYLVFPKEKYYLSIFVALLIIIYPLYDMETAGFFATLTNYIWPLSSLLISFIPVKKSLNGGGERVGLFENIISIIFFNLCL